MAGINFIENEQYLPKLKFRMETTMEQLIAKINKMESNNISVIKIWANELLEKEKQQLKESYDKGYSDGIETASNDIFSRI